MAMAVYYNGSDFSNRFFLAEPVFDPNRCSLGFHPLHSWPAIGIYLVSLFSPRLRIIAIGLLIHLVLDGTDCFWTD